jgi:UDP-N-acetylglucosamine--N-acetylmuramyl-(pentapeptide) pyrophosphoryl-undecaprenol N-acetylglucosamine transferase
LALSEALSNLRPDLKVFFVGAIQGVEARILPERGVDHLLVPVRGFRRGKVLENLAVLWALLRSLLATGKLFSRLRPGVVVVTGGYAGGPAGLMAGVMGIPLALQEQNARPGFTTRVLSLWSRQVHLAFPESRELLPRKARSRARMSGNPVRAVTEVEEEKARAQFELDPRAQVVLIVGGSQGAKAINQATLDMIAAITRGDRAWPGATCLLWATGPKNFGEVKEGLEALGSPPWVRIVDYIHDMPSALGIATLAVSRAGAMSTSELLAWGIPGILIPLPTAAADHQTRNAESLADSGCALHLPEKNLTGEGLHGALSGLLSNPESMEGMRRAALERGRPNASQEIAAALGCLLPPPGASSGKRLKAGGT